ncbi:12001_t:CDS:10, partial [Acaulospora morrowiae]
VQSKPMDIFFIVGPDGESLKWLESEANVKIYVDLSTITYTISGTKRDIRKTKEIIKKLTTYTTITVELPSHIKGESKTLKELMPYVQDICRTSGAFIELENNNKITISAQTQRNIKEAQRLLNIAWMQPDQNENHLILYSNKRETSKYCFLPVHDIVTLSMFHRNMYWHRLAEVSKSDEEPTVHNKLYRLHESKSVIKDPVSWSLYSKTEAEMDFNKLGSFLRTHLNTGRTPNTRLEIVSTFGHNIFHDKTKSMQNIFLPPLEGSHSREIIGKWYETKNPTKLFLPSYPQPDLLESLNQLSESQTVVQLDYLPCQTNSSDSICLTSDRLSFRFDVINKSLRLNDFSIYKRRLLVDILMMDCNFYENESPKDIRLLSSIKESLLGSQDITHFVSQCTLYNSRDIQCPKEYVLEGKSFSVPYTLESARIHRNGYYEYNGFVLAVKKVVEQETNTVRPEISLLYEPSINSQSSPAAQSEVQNHEDFKHWKNFIFSAIRIANS